MTDLYRLCLTLDKLAITHQARTLARSSAADKRMQTAGVAYWVRNLTNLWVFGPAANYLGVWRGGRLVPPPAKVAGPLPAGSIFKHSETAAVVHVVARPDARRATYALVASDPDKPPKVVRVDTLKFDWVADGALD